MPNSPKLLLFTYSSLWKWEAFWEEKTGRWRVCDLRCCTWGNTSLWKLFQNVLLLSRRQRQQQQLPRRILEKNQLLEINCYSSGKISKGADSSQQPKQTVSILTDPDPRTGKRKEVVAARVNRIISSSSTSLKQLLINCKLGSLLANRGLSLVWLG